MASRTYKQQLKQNLTTALDTLNKNLELAGQLRLTGGERYSLERIPAILIVDLDPSQLLSTLTFTLEVKRGNLGTTASAPTELPDCEPIDLDSLEDTLCLVLTDAAENYVHHIPNDLSIPALDKLTQLGRNAASPNFSRAVKAFEAALTAPIV